MTELKDGLIIDHNTIESSGFTYRGKPVTFKKHDENTNTYIGEVKFTEEEKELGNVDSVLTYQVDQPKGTVVVNQALDEFEGLTDAEKFTKMNSLEYQTGRKEPTQIADGSQATHIGVQASNSEPAKKSLKEREKLEKKIQEKRENAALKRKENAAKQQKEFEQKQQAVQPVPINTTVPVKKSTNTESKQND